MIDLNIENALTLAGATKLMQLKKNGRGPHVSQLYRWCARGIRGIVLESVVIGGARCTTAEAVERWIARLSDPDAGESSTRTPLRRQRDHDRAEKELAAAGWQ